MMMMMMMMVAKTGTLERLVYRQLFAYLQRHSILHETQPGYTGHITPHKMYLYVCTIDDWRQALHEDKLVGTVTIDLRDSH